MAKTKLTLERKEVIVRALEAGNYDEIAVQAAGVSKASFYNWLKRGQAELERVESAPNARVRQSERPFVDFLDAVTRARAKAEPEMVSRVKELGQQDWRALAWVLERRFPSRWANTWRVEVEVERQLEQMFDLLERSLEPLEFRKVIKILASPALEARRSHP